jgi:proline dehydrogenase
VNIARRFVAGERIEDAIAAVRRLNDRGMSASIDFLGEDVHSMQDALAVRGEYLLLLDALADAGARSNVSVKLTALGLLVDRGLCMENLRAILTRAGDTTRRTLIDPFVRIDMEGSALTETTLHVFEEVFAEHKNVGLVLQAYLHRTAADVARAIALGARVRLCKGAYKEPAQIAIHDMPGIRQAFVELAGELLTQGNYPAIATHDESLHKAVKAFTSEHGIAKDRFEFQMLYGVRPDLQARLTAEGYNMRVYVPYGTHWAQYFYRRIRERRENAFLALRALVGR